MPYVAAFLAFLKLHPALPIVFWLVVTGITNFLLAQKTPEEWIEILANKPLLGLVIRTLRSVGFDPVRLIRAFQDYANGRVRSPLPTTIPPPSTPSKEGKY